MGVNIPFYKKIGRIRGVESVWRKSGEGVKTRENSNKTGRVDRYAVVYYIYMYQRKELTLNLPSIFSMLFLILVTK